MSTSISTRIVRELEPLLGRFTAGKALSVACERVGCEEQALTASDVVAVCDGLRPMLRTLLGKDTTVLVLAQIVEQAGGDS